MTSELQVKSPQQTAHYLFCSEEEKKNAQTIVELFEDHQILSRAMERDFEGLDLTDPETKIKLKSWDREITLLHADDLKNASCTLLVSGCAVGTYKNYGMLFNAKTSQVFHASAHDILSCVNSEGKKIVPLTKGTFENLTLEELRDYILNTPLNQRSRMNEVNAHFKKRDALGLFINDVSGSSPLFAQFQLEIFYIQQVVKKHFHTHWPVFTYDQDLGKLTFLSFTPDRIVPLLIKVKNFYGKVQANHLALGLGFRITDKGQIQAL